MIEFQLFFFIPFVLIFFIIFIVYIATSKTRNSINDTFEKVALKRKGNYKISFFNPKIEFFHKDHKIIVRIQPGGKNSPPRTYIDIKLNLSQDIRMRVYRENIFSKFGKKLGTQDILTGNPSFDDFFMIKGDDEYTVLRILNFELQNKILESKNVSMRFIPSIHLDKKRLYVMVINIPQNQNILNHLIDISIMILDRLEEMYLTDPMLNNNHFKKNNH